MIDPGTGSQLVTVYRPDGTERHLKMLEPLDWLGLGNTLKATRKAERRAEMAAEFKARQAAEPEPAPAPPRPPAASPGMPPVPGLPQRSPTKTPAERHAEEVKAAMAAIDRRPVRYLDIENFVNELPGQYAAILISIGKDHPPGTPAEAVAAEFKSLGLHPAAWAGVAARLLDLKTVSVPLPESPAGGASADSTPPPTGGGSPTGSGQPSTPQETPSGGLSTDSIQQSAA